MPTADPISTFQPGACCTAARAALDRYLDQNEAGTLDKAEMFAAVERTRALFAQLIGADPDEIAYTRNVTDGIATLAASLPWKPGDNVMGNTVAA